MGHVWFWMMGSHRGPGEEFSDAAGWRHKCQGLLSRQGQFVLKTISATGRKNSGIAHEKQEACKR